MSEVILEGKTKKIVPIKAVRLMAKDDITAGDGAKHDLLKGKGKLATKTTCNVFELLKACGIPVAYYTQDTPTSFVAPFVRMNPFEVVIRREAHGSYLKRFHQSTKGERFEVLKSEFFLKTTGRQWGRYSDLECDDPYMEIKEDAVYLYNPSKPWISGTFFLRIPAKEMFTSEHQRADFPLMGNIAAKAFLILEKAWDLTSHRRLVDFKVEFGVDSNGELLLADVIDNDSWRVLEDERYIDKQVYRDNGDLALVLENYRRVALLTDGFIDMHAHIRDWFQSL